MPFPEPETALASSIEWRVRLRVVRARSSFLRAA